MKRISSGLMRGSSVVETLIALPIVLSIGFGALQFALLFHAREALHYALMEAARDGSTGHAAIDRIESGLARGLTPYWTPVSYSARGAVAQDLAVRLSAEKLRRAQNQGWLMWQQISPDLRSFRDWAEPVLGGPSLRNTSGGLEIPNDNLNWGRLRHPKSGYIQRGDAFIGRLSGQTLRDANILKLELRYGAPMVVPLVGVLAVSVMRVLDGCVNPFRMHTNGSSWRCSFYRGWGSPGGARWPLRVFATARMQSSGRMHAKVSRRLQ